MDISKFLSKIKSNTDISDIYFCLDWIDKYPKYESIWSLKLPDKKFNINKTIKIKYNLNYIHLHIYGLIKNDENTDTYSDLNDIPKNIDYINFSNTSMLKSIIQKSIRRKNTSLAILASFHLMRLDIQEFLRRIIIIALEDSCLHQSLSILLWFMIMNKNIIISKKHIRYFLGIVYYLSNNKHYDRIIIDKSKKFNLRDIFDYQNYQKNILLSIWIRSIFGGMKGDIIMLDNILNNWSSYILNSKLKIRLTEKIYFIKINQYLNIDNIPLYSVDFHCYPGVINKIIKKYPQFDKE